MSKIIRSTLQSKLMIRVARKAMEWKFFHPERNARTPVGQALPKIVESEYGTMEIIKELKPEDIQNIRWPKL